MKLRAEVLTPDVSAIAQLRQQVAKGEGLQLEFKRKVAYPEKVARELIAFANTQGGTLLIGVDDDGTLPGVRYPEEEILEVRKVLQRQVSPRIAVTSEILALNQKKFIVRLEVKPHSHRPVFFVYPNGKRDCFVRYQDQSMKASDEMCEIVRLAKWKRDVHFTFGEAESKLLTYLTKHSSITLSAFCALTSIPRKEAAAKLVKLVLANILRITPHEKGDMYARV